MREEIIARDLLLTQNILNDNRFHQLFWRTADAVADLYLGPCKYIK